MGGWLALDYAMRQREQVTPVALLSPGGVGRRKTGALFQAAPLLSLGHGGRLKTLTLALGPEIVRASPTSRDPEGWKARSETPRCPATYVISGEFVPLPSTQIRA